MKLMQCWDDGVTTDIRLVEILRRHGARASFNLNAGLHGPRRQRGWLHQGSEVWRLGRDEWRSVYEGFTVANHSLTHPRLDELPIEQARQEIAQGREQLQQIFGQPVLGFAYPFGGFNAAVAGAVREAGHLYARTTGQAESQWPPADAMALHPSCHFMAPDFWQRLDQARACGVFHFWGHSYEMTTPAQWAAFEQSLVRLNQEPGAHWVDIAAQFTPPDAAP
jgi:peptidoglycan/xylan/chitin deacetylase (PgdA/CDA1 family)